jgi:ABC-2 type transport system permease protein
MRNIWSIFKKEIISFFSSPIAYMLITVYLVLSGYFFYLGFVRFANYVNMIAANPQYSQQLAQLNLAEHVLRPLSYNICIVVLLLIPMLTMRLYSEENKMGTMELLLTSPLGYFEIVFGKFFASLFVYAVMMLFSAVYLLIIISYGKIEMGPIITSYLGLFLIGMAFLSIGNFTSTLTKNQVVAAVLGFGILLLFWVLGWGAANAEGRMAGFLSALSITEHFDSFSKGVLTLKDIVYYLSFTFIGLFLTKASLESTKWRL